MLLLFTGPRAPDALIFGVGSAGTLLCIIGLVITCIVLALFLNRAHRGGGAV